MNILDIGESKKCHMCLLVRQLLRKDGGGESQPYILVCEHASSGFGRVVWVVGDRIMSSSVTIGCREIHVGDLLQTEM